MSHEIPTFLIEIILRRTNEEIEKIIIEFRLTKDSLRGRSSAGIEITGFCNFSVDITVFGSARSRRQITSASSLVPFNALLRKRTLRSQPPFIMMYRALHIKSAD